MTERDDLKTIAEGVISVKEVLGNSRFSAPDNFDSIQRTRFIRETSTDKTFYRLGEEFLSVDALILAARQHPLLEVRNEATELISEALQRQTL